MKHMRCARVAAVVLGFLFAASACGGKGAAESAPPEASGDAPPRSQERLAVDFENGNLAFLSVYDTPLDSDKAELSIIEKNGGRAVKCSLASGKIPYIVIDASSLLGDAVSRLKTMEVTIETENPDGTFFAVSGEILAYSGEDRVESTSPWSVYLPEKNPNIARVTLDENERFVPNAYNFFILKKKVDNAIAAGQTPSNLVISSIRFLDEGGEPLPVNQDAAFNKPEGFGELDRSNLLATGAESPIAGAEGSSSGGWGQAVALPTLKNGGGFDPALLTKGGVVTVYYSSANPPGLILQSWTPEAPPSSGWAQVSPANVNNTGTIAQYLYEDLVAAFGTDDFSAFLDQFYVGDTGAELNVGAVTISARIGSAN